MERAIRSQREGLGTSGLIRVLLSFGVGLILVGCSGGSSNPGPVTQSVPPSLPAAKPAPDPKKSADVPKQGDESVEGLEHRVAVHTDANGRKWLGDVPYDVFFDHPLEVAAEGAQSKKA